MNRSLVILGVAALAFAGCQQFKKGEGEMLYKVHTDKDGPTIKEGDFIALKAIQKTEGDSVIYSSYETERPSFIPQQKPVFKGDLFTGLALLSEGDSATFKISIDSMEKKMGAPRPAGSKDKYMVYVLKIDKVIPKGKMTDQQFNTMIEDYLKKESLIAKDGEGKKLDKYIADKGLKVQSTASGLKYVVTKMGSGPKANPGDTVEVNYTGSYVTGKNKVFDTSVEAVAKEQKIANPNHGPYVPLKVPVGMQQTIPGFDEGLAMFPAGTSFKLLIPSNLAYGDRGNQMIPPFTSLAFDMEIIRIIPGKGAPTVAAPPVAPPAQ